MHNETALNGWKRSHRISEISSLEDGTSVLLMGWVLAEREHKNVIFVDLRDVSGTAQIVFDPDFDTQPLALAKELHQEYVIAVKGVIRSRPEGMTNQKLSTGHLEVMAHELKILNRCPALPIQLGEEMEATETQKLRYRYLDLRRPSVRDPILQRIRFVRSIRQALERRNFLDIETPMLYKSTPEGAREFLVPSRVHPKQFYALPQSPQLFKQTLMVAGFDRYYQIVRCFRDEDLRADRQPEFTQIDCEMSFVEQEDVLQTFEAAIKDALRDFDGYEHSEAFRRMTYAEAMDTYGTDKPDLRFGLPLQNLSNDLSNTGFKVFDEALAQKGIVNALVIEGGAAQLSRKDIDQLTEIAKQNGAKGLAWAKKQPGEGAESWQSPIAKFLNPQSIAAIESKLSLKAGDFVCFSAGPYEANKLALGAVRNALGRHFNLAPAGKREFLWVVDFPLVEYDAEAQRWLARHHPFTAPRPEDLHLLESDIGKVRAAAYDLVLNGSEVGGGSIRIHDPKIQDQQFQALGLSREQIQKKFSFLLEALSYGAPPHGGIAFGLDRFIAVLLGIESIKDVIAFPKTNKGACLMTESPGEVDPRQLKDLHIQLLD